jgi:hypothetical protein
MYGVMENDTPLRGWVGIDLDGTLAVASENLDEIGEPIPEMAERLLRFHRAGVQVKIFTARASTPKQVPLIKAWLQRNQLPDIEITNIKDAAMARLYDDKAVQVIRNTGRIVSTWEQPDSFFRASNITGRYAK